MAAIRRDQHNRCTVRSRSLSFARIRPACFSWSPRRRTASQRSPRWTGRAVGDFGNARSTCSARLRRWPPQFLRSHLTAGVCAFSLTSRITQRDGTTGRDAPGSRTLLDPSDPGPRRPAPPRRSRASGRPAGTPAYSMIPGWRPPPGPGSPGVRRHPAEDPVGGMTGRRCDGLAIASGLAICELPCMAAKVGLRTVLPSASLAWSPQVFSAGTETALIGLIVTKLRFIVYDKQLSGPS